MSLASLDTSTGRNPMWGALALCVAVVAALPVFWLGLESLGVAWLTPEYSHGPLIPVISLFLFLRELRSTPEVGATRQGWKDSLPGLCIGMIALALAGLGNVMGVPDFVAYAFIIWVMALVLITMGWTRGRNHWAPVLHLIFMLPLPQVVYWTATTWLQGLSAEIGVGLIRVADIPVLLDGHVIDLGVYKLQVAEACAGLRYLFPILSFSYLTAILYRGPFSHKVILFAMAGPVAVILNAVRIGVIGILVDRYGIGHAEGFLHLFEGWVVFGLSLVILFATAALLMKVGRRSGPMLDLNTDGLAGEVARVRDLGGAVPVLALSAVAVVLSMQLVLSPARTEAPMRQPFIALDLRVSEWVGQRESLDPQIAKVLGADDYLAGAFASPSQSAPVQLFVAWYENQNQGAGLHSPTVCLPAAGWEIAELDEVTVALDGGFVANRAIIGKDLEQQLVYYWFEQGGHRVTGDWETKILALRRSLLESRADGALIRFTTTILPGEDIGDADARVFALMQDTLPRLGAHLPD